MIDKQRLVQTLVAAYGFYDKELSPLVIRIWEDTLGNEDTAAVEEAFTSHLRDPDAGRFLPKPADIIRQLRGDLDDRALMAWGEVLSAARNGGGFQDGAAPATRQAIEAMGGWSAICRADEGQNGFLQRRFVDLFKAYQRRDEATTPALDHTNVVRITR